MSEVSPHCADPRLATRIAFLACGFGLACWAPLVPLAKSRLQVSDGALGLLLLCLGLGSVVAMLLAGPVTSRLGARRVVLTGGIGMALLLPLLSFAPTIPVMAVALFGFGGFLGAIEVGMNVHAVEVEKAADRPLMSGFHGLFSVGGFAGSALLTLALSTSAGGIVGTIIGAAMMIVGLLFAARHFLQTTRSADVPLAVVPRGIVILLAALAAVTFLAEGAILDWGALLLTDKHLVPQAQAGVGYSIFAIAMTVGRLSGDTVVARVGDRGTMFFGGILAIIGFVALLTASVPAIGLASFALIGLGASNTVPILFRQAGNQTRMPAGLAVAAVTTVGYAGILAGPAGIGFVAQHTGLQGAFWMLAGLLCLVPLCATIATPRR